MMKETSKLDAFFEYIKAGATCRGHIKQMYILKARAIMKTLTKQELKEIPEMTDGLDGYEMSVFWGIGIRNPAQDATMIRIAERQLAAIQREKELNNESQ